MQRLTGASRQVTTWRRLEARLDDAEALLELAAEADDAASVSEAVSEAAAEVATARAQFDGLEFELSFAGPYDDRDAILAIHAGAGGTESQDWAEMLQRMYLRWFERKGFDATLVDVAQARRPASRAPPSRCAGGWPTAGCAASAACTAWCASPPSTSRTRATHPSLSSR